MEVLDQGVNAIFMDPDPDKAREFFRKKPRAMVDKRMTEKEAVERFVPDGCYLAIGGFGANRIPNSIVHEIVRSAQKEPGLSRPHVHSRFPGALRRQVSSTAWIPPTSWGSKPAGCRRMPDAIWSPARCR